MSEHSKQPAWKRKLLTADNHTAEKHTFFSAAHEITEALDYAYLEIKAAQDAPSDSLHLIITIDPENPLSDGALEAATQYVGVELLLQAHDQNIPMQKLKGSKITVEKHNDARQVRVTLPCNFEPDFESIRTKIDAAKEWIKPLGQKIVPISAIKKDVVASSPFPRDQQSSYHTLVQALQRFHNLEPLELEIMHAINRPGTSVFLSNGARWKSLLQAEGIESPGTHLS